QHCKSPGHNGITALKLFHGECSLRRQRRLGFPYATVGIAAADPLGNHDCAGKRYRIERIRLLVNRCLGPVWTDLCARHGAISHGCWLGSFCAAASSPVFGSAAGRSLGGRTGRHAPRRGPPHEFPTTCRVRSPRTGTPLRPPMSCEYNATAYATPPP